MSIQSRTPIITTDTGQGATGQTAGTATSLARHQRVRSFLSSRRLPPGPALLVIVTVSVLLWIGLFYLLRAAWHLL